MSSMSLSFAPTNSNKPRPFVLEERPKTYNPKTGEMEYKDAKPSPFVLGERPVIFNPITGELEYKDNIKPKHVCYFA